MELEFNDDLEVLVLNISYQKHIITLSRYKMKRAVIYNLSVFLALLTGAFAAEVSLSPAVILPDGQEFKTWEAPLKFSRTYYVDQRHNKAADNNPGTADLPFRTLNRAAQVLQPGERVVVAAGIYRERVAPARGGAGPDRMISYEAAPSAEVILSGSEVLPTNWAPSKLAGQDDIKSAWMTTLPAELFADENPFAEINLTGQQFCLGRQRQRDLPA